MALARWLILIMVAVSFLQVEVRAYGQVEQTSGVPALPNTRSPSSSDNIAPYQTRCPAVLPDLAHADSVEANFTILKEARQKVASLMQQAYSDRDYFKQQVDQRQFSVSLPAYPLLPTPTAPDRDLDPERDKATTDVNKRVEELNRATKEPSPAPELLAKLTDEKTAAESNLADIKRQIDRRDEAQKQVNEYQKHVEEFQKAQEQENNLLQSIVRSANSDIDCLGRMQSQIDEAINTLLIPETQKNQFKLWVSGIFAFMVILVIAGFFTVAFRDKQVASAIFSNQTGFQFVTLFSLVMAIILFGINDVLQAKELSALLGGISGYILGRVTTDRTSAPRQEQQPALRKPSIVSNTIGFTSPNIISGPAGLFADLTPGMQISITGASNVTNTRTFSIDRVTTTQAIINEQTLSTEPEGASVKIAAV